MNSKTLKYNEEPLTKYEVNKILSQPMWHGYCIINPMRIQYTLFDSYRIPGMILTKNNWKNDLIEFKNIIDTFQKQLLTQSKQFHKQRIFYLRLWTAIRYNSKKAKINGITSQKIRDIVSEYGNSHACIYKNGSVYNIFNFVNGNGLFIAYNIPSKEDAKQLIKFLDKTSWDWDLAIQIGTTRPWLDNFYPKNLEEYKDVSYEYNINYGQLDDGTHYKLIQFN